MTSAATITHSTGSISAAALTDYRAQRAAGTIVQKISNRSDPDYTLRPFDLRTGSFVLVFDSVSDADAALAALCIPQVLSLACAVRTGINMAFIIPGGTAPELTPGSAGETTISVDFQEIAP